MSDSVDQSLQNNFEPEAEDDDYMIVDPDEEQEGESETEEVSLSKEEYDQLMSKTDANQTLSQSIDRLGQQLRQEGDEDTAEALPQQQPGESDEDFSKRFEEELFASGKSYKAIKEAMQRMMGPVLGQQSKVVSDQAKKILFMENPVAKNYQKKIESYVKKSGRQWDPSVWEEAWKSVQLEPDVQEEIIEQKVQERLKQQQPETETENTVEVSEKKDQKPNKKRVYLKSQERAKIERFAEQQGVPFQEALRYFGKL